MIGEDGEIYVIDFDRFDLEILGRNSIVLYGLLKSLPLLRLV